VSALAHINALDLALATTRGLLRFPNDAEAAYTVRYMKDTLEVPAQTFGVVDSPLGVVLDRSGTIRFIGVLPSDAFDENGYISKVLDRMFAKSGSKGN
jgi:hypothetical protein